MRQTGRAVALAGLLTSGAVAYGAAFTPGNLAVYRAGDGAAALSGNMGHAVFVDEYRIDGTQVQSIAMPTSGANALTTTAGADTGLLNRSANGRCLTLTGVAGAAGAASAGLPRAAVFLLADGTLGATAGASTLVSFGTAFTDDSIRASVSDDCQQVWVTGNRGSSPATRGLYYIARDGTGLAGLSTGNAMQGLTIAGARLYVSVGGGTGTVSQVGSGLPATGSPVSTAFDPGPAVNKNYRAIGLLDLDSTVPGVDTLYVANNSDGRLEKYYGSGTSWTAAGTVAQGKISGLVARDIGTGAEPAVALYFTDTDTNQVLVLVDRAGRTGALAGTPQVLVPAVANRQVRGVAFTPESSPPTQAPTLSGQAAATANPADTAGSFVATWAAASGSAVAFYVVEVAAGGDFSAIAQTVQVPAPATRTTITGLSGGTGYRFRVRAVNTAGSSTSVASETFTTAARPVLAGLTDGSAYPLTAGDATESLTTRGLPFTVSDGTDAASALDVAATSDNTAVLPAGHLRLERGTGGRWTLKISSAGLTMAGYANVTVKVTGSGGRSARLVLRVAVSVRSAADLAGDTHPRWIAGRADASAGIPIGTRYVLVADDEPKNVLNLYDRTVSGPPVKTFDLSADLGVAKVRTDNCLGLGAGSASRCDGESDLEAGTRIGARSYWLGSHSNNSSGNLRPDRWRFFAYDIAGTDAATTLAPAGHYRHLRADLLAWDHGNRHGLGADYFGLTASAAYGLAPESDDLDGFSFEGMAPSPDDSRMWMAFRAPLVPAPGRPAVTAGSAAGRTHALILQVTNYSALLRPDGGQQGQAALGQPIRLDLGGRGIRDIQKNAIGQYLIIAGPPHSATGAAPRDFRLYSWDGSYDTNGLATGLYLRPAALGSFTNPAYGGSVEGIVAVPNPLTASSTIDLISDSGDVAFYGDGVAAKDLGNNGITAGDANVAIKKSRIDTVSLGAIQSTGTTYTDTAPGGAVVAATVGGVGNGSTTCTFERARWVPVSAASASPPAGLVFAQGLLDFALAGCAVGGQARLTLTYPGPVPPGAAYWKYRASTRTWSRFPVVVAGNTVEVTLEDGGAGDDDGVRDGRIVDPGGLALLAAGGVTGVPTLSEWARAGMALLVGVAGALHLRGARRPTGRLGE